MSQTTLTSLSSDDLASCLLMLSAKDLASTCATCNALRTLGRDLWWTVLKRAHSGLALELLARSVPDDPHTVLQYTVAAKRADNLALLRHIGQWHQASPGTLPAQEGHSSALLDGRWWVVVCGFTNSGVNNTAFVCDTLALERKEALTWSRLTTDGDSPRPKYGHTACALGPRHLAILGGVRYGGYRGDVSDCHILSLDASGDNPTNGTAEWQCIRAAPDGECTSRAYCSLTLVPAICCDGSDMAAGPSLMAFGGIHEGEAIGALERLRLTPDLRPRVDAAADDASGALADAPPAGAVWQAVDATGAPPAGRFGHSAHLHERTKRLILVGGSDGSDLLRDGRDFHVDGNHEGEGGQGDGVFTLQLDTMEWSRLRMVGEAVPPLVQLKLAGRCHISILVHDHILCFGGGEPLPDSSLLDSTRLDLTRPDSTLTRLDLITSPGLGEVNAQPTA